MADKRSSNPFYAVLVVTGVVFGVTALAYGAMAAIAQHNPVLAYESIESGRGLVAVMDQHGFRLMLIELAVLATATVLAIATDELRAGRRYGASTSQKAEEKTTEQQEPADEGAPLRAD